MKKINLNIAGAVVHYDMLIKLLPVLKLKYKNIDLNVYDGPNLCQWNGGRINRDITITSEMIQRYNKFGISVSFAFTNPEIDLDDETGNYLLKLLDESQKKYNIKNKVILVNEEFRRYLRANYNFELIYSITGHQSEVKINSKMISLYKELEEKYDFIVPKFEVVFEPKFYNEINPVKYELLINDKCKYGCKLYNEHFKEIAKQNNLSKNPWNEFGVDHCFKVEECWIPDFNPDIGSEKDNSKYGEKIGMTYNRDMIKKSLDLGYTSFKLSGRENSPEILKQDIERFYNDINEK